MTAGAQIAHVTGQRGRRNKALPLPASATPNHCVRLCVDTAANSGWCIGTREWPVINSGEVKALNHAALVDIIGRAIQVARDNGFGPKPERHVVLVLEKPWRGKPKGQAATRSQYAVQGGLGAARGMWLSAWCEVMGTATPHRVVMVYPQEWRRRVLGGTGGHLLPHHEKRTAKLLRAKNDLLEARDVGKDEAAAICMSKWAQYAGEVRKAITPKPKKAKAT